MMLKMQCSRWSDCQKEIDSLQAAGPITDLQLFILSLCLSAVHLLNGAYCFNMRAIFRTVPAQIGGGTA